jgi:hypothetical protein
MRHHVLRSAFVLTAACLAMTGLAKAQPNQVHDSETMNFDLWCQEDAGLPPDRCDKRTPQDESRFEAYRAAFERHEIPYLAPQNSQATINRDIMNSDPVDNPQKDDLGPQQQ